MTAEQLIDLLKLQKHPNEGGYFRETYRSRASFDPTNYAAARSVSTAIYYLITPDSFSALHRLPGDEIFHHYLGEPVEMLMLRPSGAHEIVRIGPNIPAGERPQVVVPGGVWQGSRLVGREGFALLGCTMAPGFDYADYQHGRRDELIAQFPAVADHIISLTT